MRRGRHVSSVQRADHRRRPRLLELGHLLAVFCACGPRLLRRRDDAKPPTALRLRRHICHRPDSHATDSRSTVDLSRAGSSEPVATQPRRVSRS
jgi:hypothetical protein